MNPLTRLRTIPHPTREALIWFLSILIGILMELTSSAPMLVDNETAQRELAVEQPAIATTLLDRADYLALLRGELVPAESEPGVMMIEATPDATYA